MDMAVEILTVTGGTLATGDCGDEILVLGNLQGRRIGGMAGSTDAVMDCHRTVGRMTGDAEQRVSDMAEARTTMVGATAVISWCLLGQMAIETSGLQVGSNNIRNSSAGGIVRVHVPGCVMTEIATAGVLNKDIVPSEQAAEIVIMTVAANFRAGLAQIAGAQVHCMGVVVIREVRTMAIATNITGYIFRDPASGGRAFQGAVQVMTGDTLIMDLGIKGINKGSSRVRMTTAAICIGLHRL